MNQFFMENGYGHQTSPELGGYRIFYEIDGKTVLSFSTERMPKQCGAYILSSFNFDYSSSKGFWVDFTKDLKEKFYGKCGKFLASAVHPEDISDHDEYSELHNMLVAGDWEIGSRAFNPNSGNYINIFELTVQETDDD